jgi:transcription initiation factor TFIIE subunit beta
MKTRHQEGQSHALSLDDILDETNQLDVPAKHKHWLLTEALRNNPKIKILNAGNGDKFLFNPPYDIREFYNFC